MQTNVSNQHMLWQSYGSNRALRLLELDLPIITRTAISAVAMGLLVLVVSTFNLPNPNMILIAGLVICSTLFGVPGGLVSGLSMMAYTLYFFSTNNDFVSFTPENFMKVLVTAIGVSVVGVFVCALKGTEDRALRDADTLANALREDNELLEQASTVDVLTGLRNRLSLRRDYATYTEEGRPLHVMMVDLDDFKNINDSCGHELGDSVLTDVGNVMLNVFGPQHAYRYGGDEFLVITPEWTDTVFDAACESMREQLEALNVGNDGKRPVHFSGGYVSGTPRYQPDLRLMIRQADDNLYHAKREGKNHVMGTAFARDAAHKLEGDGRSVRYGDRM